MAFAALGFVALPARVCRKILRQEIHLLLSKRRAVRAVFNVLLAGTKTFDIAAHRAH